MYIYKSHCQVKALLFYYLTLLMVWPAGWLLILLPDHRSISAAGAAQEVRVKGHQPHAQQPRRWDFPTCAKQQPLHPGGPALHQRGLWRPSDRLSDHSEFTSPQLCWNTWNFFFFPLYQMIISVFLRTLVNSWGRTGSLRFQSLPTIPRASCQLRGPRRSWSVTLDTGQWSSPRPPSLTCRQ